MASVITGLYCTRLSQQERLRFGSVIFLLVEIGGLRVVIAPRGEDIVALPHAGTAVDLRMKKLQSSFICAEMRFISDE